MIIQLEIRSERRVLQFDEFGVVDRNEAIFGVDIFDVAVGTAKPGVRLSAAC